MLGFSENFKAFCLIIILLRASSICRINETVIGIDGWLIKYIG